MVVGSQHLCALRIYQFHKHLHLIVRAAEGLAGKTHIFRMGKMAVADPQTLIQNMRLGIVKYLHIFIGKGGFEGGKQPAAPLHEPTDSQQQLLRGRIQGRHHQKVVILQILRIRPQEIAAHIQPVQLVVHVADHIVIFVIARASHGSVHRKPVEGAQRLVAHQQSHPVVFFQIHQMAADLLKFLSDHFCRPVGVIFLEIMAQKPLPVGFKGIVDGMPVPVFHHIGAGGHMAVGLKPQLPVVGRPPGESLGLRLQHQIVVPFQGTGAVAAEGNFFSGEIVLGGMVDIHPRHRQRPGCMEMVHHGLHAPGISLPVEVKVVGDKLIRPGVFLHNIRLPL